MPIVVEDINILDELAASHSPNIGLQLPGEQYSLLEPQYPLVLQQDPNAPPMQVWFPQLGPHSP